MQVQATYRNILQIALPIIIGSLSQALLNIIDTAFLGRVDEITLAAGALGGTYYMIFSLIVMAMAMGVQIIIARREGEGNLIEIGATFNQGAYLVFSFGVLLFLFMLIFSELLMKLFISNNEIYLRAIDYINYRSFGLLFVSFATACRAFYIGISQTAIITYVTVIMSVFNGFLDYFLIFGKGPFPEMGIRGAALASSLSEVLACIVFVIFTRYRHDFRKYRIFHLPKPDLNVIKKIIKLSYPSVFQYFLSIVSWFTFFVIIEKTGQNMLAASNVIRAVLMLLMFPGWGFASTANTMVSNLIGQQKHDQLFKLLAKVIKLNLMWSLVLLPFIIFIPDLLLHVITNDQKIIEMSLNSVNVIFGALIVFAVSANLVHGLIGTGDTKTAFLFEVVALFGYLIYTYCVAIVFNSKLEVIWLAELFYWLIIGVLSYYRLKSKKWKKILV